MADIINGRVSLFFEHPSLPSARTRSLVSRATALIVFVHFIAATACPNYTDGQNSRARGYHEKAKLNGFALCARADIQQSLLLKRNCMCCAIASLFLTRLCGLYFGPFCLTIHIRLVYFLNVQHCYHANLQFAAGNLVQYNVHILLVSLNYALPK